MDSALLTEMAKQAPWLVGFLLLVWINHSAEEKREKSRTENAKALEDRREKHEKELEEKREAHDRDINNMWASYIKAIVEQQNSTYKALMETIEQHEQASANRYERMGITKELIEAVKERQKR